MMRPALYALVLLGASPAFAQDAATLAAADRLVEVTEIGPQLEQGLQLMVPAMAKNVMAQLAASETTRAMFEEVTKNDYARKQKLEALFTEEFLAAMRAALPRFKREYVREYASAFSKAELDALNSFFSQGAGARYVAQTPAISAKLAATSQRIGMEVAMVTFPKVIESAKTELAETSK